MLRYAAQLWLQSFAHWHVCRSSCSSACLHCFRFSVFCSPTSLCFYETLPYSVHPCLRVFLKHLHIPFTHVSAFLRNTSVFCSPTSPRFYETLLYSVHPCLRVFTKHFCILFTNVPAFLIKHFRILFTHVSAFLWNTSVFCSPTSPRFYETLLYSVHPRLRVFMKHFCIPFTHVSAFLWNTSVYHSPTSPRFYGTLLYSVHPRLRVFTKHPHCNMHPVAAISIGRE